ncbi:CRP-like cAMP-binding protein [Pedobacter cryoconitis]|uniref:CRP-like cAMP-binding protein n=1 Tax=Pedobacter cryoconitis TaxID=188932 RepID=A0A7W8ZQS7_9SPHI|nr:Crp/Fnr family transcriptional regulator [Pedobacter cryoconitis]MBB5638323.1 CRP-like cAMP-binding protein [Pedobacter cryoconitis]
MTENKFYLPLLDQIKKDVKLDDETINAIAENCKEVSFPKDHLLLREGDDCKYAYLIVSGEARSFYTEFTGKTTTWLFHFNNSSGHIKNHWLIDYKSFLTGDPSTFNIETLSEVKAIQLCRSNVISLIEKQPLYEHWTRILNEKVFIVTYNRVFAMLTMSATDRYKKLLAEEPHLLQLFSNYYIASYLGITPQSLSRIRGRMAKER